MMVCAIQIGPGYVNYLQKKTTIWLVLNLFKCSVFIYLNFLQYNSVLP